MSNPLLRFLLLSILLAGGVALAHLVPGIDGSDIERHIRNSLHIIGFAGVAWIIFELAPFGRPGKAFLALTGAVALGALAELAQRFSGYSFSGDDIVRDAAGAGLMIVARLLWPLGKTVVSRVFLRTIAAIAVCTVFTPFAYWSWGILSERLKAPVIMDFDGPFARHYFGPTNSDVSLTTVVADDDTAETQLLEIMLSRAPRSGVLVATALYDWRAYEWLVFDARILTGPDASVSVHINDYNSIGHFADTAAGMVTVTGDLSSHRVPIREVLRQAGRADDVSSIRQVALFARSRHRGAVMQIDNLRLE